jgi:hypothetical protein
MPREIETCFALQHPNDCHARGHNRGLRIFGQDKIIVRSFPHQFAEPLPEGFVNLLKNVACCWERLGKGLAHANRLAALPRKDKCSRHASADKTRQTWQVKARQEHGLWQKQSYVKNEFCRGGESATAWMHLSGKGILHEDIGCSGACRRYRHRFDRRD